MAQARAARNKIFCLCAPRLEKVEKSVQCDTPGRCVLQKITYSQISNDVMKFLRPLTVLHATTSKYNHNVLLGSFLSYGIYSWRSNSISSIVFSKVRGIFARTSSETGPYYKYIRGLKISITSLDICL